MNIANTTLLDKLETIFRLVERSDFGTLACIPKEHALQALQDLRRQVLTSGSPDVLEASMLFAPTAGLKAVSIENGWGREFLALAQELEEAVAGSREL